MQVTITDKIIDPCNEDEDFNRVEFTVSYLIDSMSVGQAYFLRNQLKDGAFRDMIEYICTTPYDEIEINKVFE